MELIISLSDYPALAVFVTAMLPVLELRGAIPLGVSLGMTPLWSFAVAVAGNLVPVAPIIIFIRQVFAWMRQHIPALGGFVERIEQRAEQKREFIYKWQLFGLFILVAIPLPGTGAWTGALIAALMDIRLRAAFPAIAAGVVAAGIIVLGITYGIAGII